MAVKIPKKFKKFKTFEQRIKDGDICDLKTGAKIAGYSEQHMRRLCSGRTPIPHERRNDSEIFFTPSQLASLFEKRG